VFVGHHLLLIPEFMVDALLVVLLSRAGTDPRLLGLFGAMPWLGILLMSTVVGALVRSCGLRGAYRLGAVLPLLLLPIFLVSDSLWIWMVASFTLIALGTFASAPFEPSGYTLCLMGILWGGLGGGLFTLVMIHVGQCRRGHGLVEGATLLVVAYTLGAAMGAPLGGLLVYFSPQLGLTILFGGMASLGLVMLGVGSLLRRQSRGAAPAATRKPFSNSTRPNVAWNECSIAGELGQVGDLRIR
jgi:MFS family permease